MKLSNGDRASAMIARRDGTHFRCHTGMVVLTTATQAYILFDDALIGGAWLDIGLVREEAWTPTTDSW